LILCILEELNESQTEIKQVKEENSALKTDLVQAQSQVHDKSEMVIDLQGKSYCRL
jgi:cell shape-determining protein MreC